MVFKECDSGGGQGLGFFNTSHNTAPDCTIVVAHTILVEQRAALESHIKDGGPLCVLRWQFDGTPQKVALQEASSVDALGGAGDQEDFKKQGKDGTRDVLVQKGVFITPEIVEDIFAKPRILGDQTSGVFTGPSRIPASRFLTG